VTSDLRDGKNSFDQSTVTSTNEQDKKNTT